MHADTDTSGHLVMGLESNARQESMSLISVPVHANVVSTASGVLPLQEYADNYIFGYYMEITK